MSNYSVLGRVSGFLSNNFFTISLIKGETDDGRGACLLSVISIVPIQIENLVAFAG
jgi:hypothetical protein